MGFYHRPISGTFETDAHFIFHLVFLSIQVWVDNLYCFVAFVDLNST